MRGVCAVKLVDNSQQFDQSPTLEQSFQSAINEGARTMASEYPKTFMAPAISQLNNGGLLK